MLVNCLFAAIACAGTAAASLQLGKAYGESPSLAKRDITGWGGYPLLVKDKPCPNSTFACGTGRCCPNGTSCFDQPNSGSASVCCPDEKNDCSGIVNSVYACSDNSWTLWAWSIRFCCAADEWGTHDDLQDRCLPKSIPVPTSIIVSQLKQFTKTDEGAAPTDIPNAPGTTAPTNPNTSQVPSSNPGDGGQGSDNGRTGNTDNRTSYSSSPGLSQPATIAIAVLSTIVALMAIFIAWILWDRARRQKSNQTPPHPQTYLGSLNTPIPVPGSNPEPPAYMAPLPQTQELHAQGAPSVLLIQQYGEVPETELDGQTYRQAQERT